MAVEWRRLSNCLSEETQNTLDVEVKWIWVEFPSENGDTRIGPPDHRYIVFNTNKKYAVAAWKDAKGQYLTPEMDSLEAVRIAYLMLNKTE